MNPAGNQTPDALTRLGRRSAVLVLAMGPGESRNQVCEHLKSAGYHRLDLMDTLEQALDHLRSESAATNRLLMLETQPGTEPPLADICTLQREFGELRELPVALIQQDGLAAKTEAALIRPLPWPGSDRAAWLPALDDLAGV